MIVITVLGFAGIFSGGTANFQAQDKPVAALPAAEKLNEQETVSYTHLTLTTICSV